MRYLLVLGTQRTGKTLTGRALNMHPNITVQAEPYFFFFKTCRNIFYRDIIKKDDFDFESPMDSCFCRSKEEKELFNKSLTSLYFSKSDIAELIKLTTKQQEIAKGERADKIIPLLNRLIPGTSISVFRDLMDILHEAYKKDGVRIVGLTEGWCDEFIQPLLECGDIDIKCIHCLRDPRAIVASRNGGSRLHVGKYPILFIIRHWRKAIAYSVLHAENPKYMALRYEDLVNAPEEWFGKVCDFLDVDFNEVLLKPETFLKGDGTLWKPNSAYKVSSIPTKGFGKGSVARWKEILPKEEVGLIEYLCAQEMDYLGFERTITDFSLKDLLSFKEDASQIVPWLQKYNLSFNKKEAMLEVVRKFLMTQTATLTGTSTLTGTQKLMDYFLIDKDVPNKIMYPQKVNV